MKQMYYFLQFKDGMRGSSFPTLGSARRYVRRLGYDSSVRIFVYMGGGYIMDVTDPTKRKYSG